jgi:nicotinamidase-related amidase
VPVPPAQTALLIIECQNGVVGEGSILPALAAAAGPRLPRIGTLARAAREAGVLVCHLTFVPVAGNRSANPRAPLFRGILPAIAAWTPTSRETQVVDEIGVGEADLVLPRAAGVSPTLGTETFKVLRNIGITQVVVAGVSVNIAIPAVLTHAADEGFSAVVARDAVIGTPADVADQMVTHVLGLLARLTTVDDLAAEWAGA